MENEIDLTTIIRRKPNKVSVSSYKPKDVKIKFNKGNYADKDDYSKANLKRSNIFNEFYRHVINKNGKGKGSQTKRSKGSKSLKGHGFYVKKFSKKDSKSSRKKEYYSYDYENEDSVDNELSFDLVIPINEISSPTEYPTRVPLESSTSTSKKDSSKSEPKVPLESSTSMSKKDSSKSESKSPKLIYKSPTTKVVLLPTTTSSPINTSDIPSSPSTPSKSNVIPTLQPSHLSYEPSVAPLQISSNANFAGASSGKVASESSPKSVAVGSIIAIVLMFIAILCGLKRRRRNKLLEDDESSLSLVLEKPTESFDDTTSLGSEDVSQQRKKTTENVNNEDKNRFNIIRNKKSYAATETGHEYGKGFEVASVYESDTIVL